MPRPAATLVWVDRKGTGDSDCRGAAELRGRAHCHPTARASPSMFAIRRNDIWIWDISRQTLTSAQSRSGAGHESDLDTRRQTHHLDVDARRRQPEPVLAARGRHRHSGASDQPSGKPVSDIDHSRWRNHRRSSDPAAARRCDGSLHRRHQRARAQGKSPSSRCRRRSDFDPEISPDGKWLAYHSNESGEFQVYVRPFPNVQDGRTQISTNGGTRAAWSRNGRELFYLDKDGFLTSVTVLPPAGAQRSPPRPPVKILNTKYFAGLIGSRA